MAKKHVQHLIEILGGPTSAGRALNKSRLTMYQWINKGYVPPESVIPAEEAALKIAKEQGIKNPPTRYQLNPEIYPN